MIYLLRFSKFVLTILTLIVRLSLTVIVGLLALLQILLFFVLLPVILALQLVEVIIMPISYYTITGKNYYQNYNPIIFVYYDTAETGKLRFAKDSIYKEKGFDEFDLYAYLFGLIWLELPTPSEYMDDLIEKYDTNK